MLAITFYDFMVQFHTHGVCEMPFGSLALTGVFICPVHVFGHVADQDMVLGRFLVFYSLFRTIDC